MHFVKSVALATLVLCTIVELSKEVKTKPVIYVDVKNGTLEMQLLEKKGVDLPFANLEQAITGVGKTHNTTIHVLPFEVSLVAFQNVQPYILVHFGSSLSHHPMTLAHVGKIFMLLSSVTKQSAILDCYCMTMNLLA